MTRVAILWHMHQPFYEDLATNEHVMPWVRLHALKDYYGMAALAGEFPGVRLTFNLVPSLLIQLEAFAEDRAQDRHLELSLKPAEDLTDADVAFILENFFHAQRQRMIEVYPRYAELLAHRGGTLPTPADARTVARRFGLAELRDLQVWHKLAWIDPEYLERDERVRSLIAKDRDFTEDDKAQLREVELEILNRVIPEYRRAAARGQIELSTSPFYHPILPLLCDTDVYLRTHPDSRKPRQRFIHPEDAAEQLRRAVALHERLFGERPLGLWPSEGSVSDAMVPLVAAAGFRWMATDEVILARSLGSVFSRDAYGHLDQPALLYTPYQISAGGAIVACAFRDHALSDLIGFTYAGWGAEAAAQDLTMRLREAGRRYSAQTGGREALVSIILDGENAWEHFEGGGRPFLRALYGALSSDPELRTVTMSEACSGEARALTGVFPGSWIDANFSIWIGHADDQRAWSQLADARHMLDEVPEKETRTWSDAYEEVLIAEGSDWFWWYGDDHSSAHDLEFDDLFRRHLRNAYKRLGKPVPDELFVSNISQGGPPALQTPPSGLLAPTLDGEETSYFEWLGAGALEIRAIGGAMHRADQPAAVLTRIWFGSDRAHLFIRLDGVRPMRALLEEGYQFALRFLEPSRVTVVIAGLDGQVGARLAPGDPGDEDGNGRQPDQVRVAAHAVLETAVPLSALAAAPGARLAFFVAVTAAGADVERHPSHRPIELTVPDEHFEARNWSV